MGDKEMVVAAVAAHAIAEIESEAKRTGADLHFSLISALTSVEEMARALRARAAEVGGGAKRADAEKGPGLPDIPAQALDHFSALAASHGIPAIEVADVLLNRAVQCVEDAHGSDAAIEWLTHYRTKAEGL